MINKKLSHYYLNKGIILSFFTVFVLHTLNAKNIRYRIMDSDNVPVAEAPVSILSLNECNLIDSKLTDSDGYVIFDLSPDSKYILYIQAYAYEPYQELLSTLSDEVITINPLATTLNDVTVIANKDILRSEAGKFIFTPGSLKYEVPSTFDLLRFSPLIQGEGDALAIIGQGNARILINGRDSRFDDQTLINYLKTISAKNVKKVEIILNPGAKEKASDSRAIINVVLNEPGNGFKGNAAIELTYSGNRLSPSASVWGIFSHGKLKLQANFNYGYSASHNKEIFDAYYHDLAYSTLNESENRLSSQFITGFIGANYKFSQKSEAGLTLGIGSSKKHDESSVRTKVNNSENDIVEETFNSINDSPFHRPTYKIIGFWKFFTDSKGSNIDVTADFYSSKSQEKFLNNLNDFNFQEINNSKMIGFHIKPYYTIFFNDRHNIDFGYELSKFNVDFDNSSSFQSTDFDYSELINSFFADWNAKWNPTVSTIIGCRVENSVINGNEKLINNKFKHNYSDVFPSIGLNLFFPKGNQSIALNLRRSIFRPWYSELNPAIIITSGNTYSVGNPELKPDYTWQANLTYSFLDNFTASLNYRHTTNQLYQYIFNVDGKSASSCANVGTDKTLSFSFSYTNVFFKIWRIKADINIYRSWIKGIINDVDLSCNDLKGNFSIFNNIVISQKHNFSAMLIYSLYSPSKELTYETKWDNKLSVVLSKQFKNNMQLQFHAINLLSYKNNKKFESPTYSYYQQSTQFPMIFNLSFQYYFGKETVRSANSRTYTNMEMRVK